MSLALLKMSVFPPLQVFPQQRRCRCCHLQLKRRQDYQQLLAFFKHCIKREFGTFKNVGFSALAGVPAAAPLQVLSPATEARER